MLTSVLLLSAAVHSRVNPIMYCRCRKTGSGTTLNHERKKQDTEFIKISELRAAVYAATKFLKDLVVQRFITARSLEE